MKSDFEEELYGEPAEGKSFAVEGLGGEHVFTVSDQGLFGGQAPKREDFNHLEDLTKALVNGQAAIEELNLLKPIFALALSKLPKKQIHVTLAEQAKLGERFAMQAKSDGKGGIFLRSVETLA